MSETVGRSGSREDRGEVGRTAGMSGGLPGGWEDHREVRTLPGGREHRREVPGSRREVVRTAVGRSNQVLTDRRWDDL